MALSFRYKKETIEGKVNYFPKIPVTLHGSKNSLDLAALLDSGATDIFVPLSIAQTLGLDLGKSEKVSSWTDKFDVKESHVSISFSKGSQVFRKSLPCMVSTIDEGHQEVILGRTFFRFFEVTFNEEKRITQLKKLQ